MRRSSRQAAGQLSDRIDLETIAREAEGGFRRTDLPHWLVDGAERLCHALRSDVRLSAIGVRAAEREIRRGLQVYRAVATAPEVPLTQPPTIVCGPPRTGTTWLHELLGSDPEVRYLRGWEARGSAAGTSEARSYTDAWISDVDRIVPGFLSIHPMRPDGPEECHIAMAGTFRSWHWPNMFGIPTYAEWLLEADRAPAIGWYRRRLGSLGVAERWVLKSPFWALDGHDAARTFPGATFIRTLRHPVDMAASTLGLLDAVHRVMLRGHDRRAMARRWVALLARVSAAVLAVDGAVTVEYRSLVSDPRRTVARIYDRLGRSVPAAVMAMACRGRVGPRVPPPSLQTFGLSSREVLDAFAHAGADRLAALPR